MLEKEHEVGLHQTGHNSGVIHSGIYYAPGSLKAKLCVDGALALVDFAEQNNIRYELCGKVIVATSEKEVPILHSLYERGKANGVPGLELVDQNRLKALEPNARGLAAIYSPKTGIIQFREVAHAMERNFKRNGGNLCVSSKVTGIKQTKENNYCLLTPAGDFETEFLINSGGLYSDKIAQMAGIRPGVRIVPFRGEYYMVRDERRRLVRNLIYPVPLPDLPFLGVHFTRTIDGKLEVGPNAVLALAREGYKGSQVNFGEFGDMFLDGRFWKMAYKYWKTGIFECYRAMSKSAFTKALKVLVPEIQEEDLVEGPSGVRAQCIDEHGALVNDFKIVPGPKAIHVLNVPSPAATASLAIGDYIVRLAASSFALRN